MKKLNYIIIAALLAASMFATACNTVSTNDDISTDTESNSETDTLQPVENVGKIVDSDMYSIYTKDGKYYMQLTDTY